MVERVTMKTAGITHVGNVRPTNEDTFMIECESSPLFMLVADGMGGHKAGEVASSMAVEFFSSYLQSTPRPEGYDLESYLREGVLFANKKVYGLSKENEAYSGMGTTFSMATVKDGSLYFAHIGDSRIYTVRQDEIKLITQDHSYVAEMVRKGTIAEEEAREHPRKNVLTRALGTEETAVVDTGSVGLSDDDIILLCSDGLSNMVPDSEICGILTAGQSKRGSIAETLEEKAGLLIRTANLNGGLDNISLILIYSEPTI